MFMGKVKKCEKKSFEILKKGHPNSVAQKQK